MVFCGRLQAMPYKDQEKERACWRRWYHKHKKKKIAWQARRRRELWVWLAELKSKMRCARCSESHPSCIVFHHRDPKKKDIDVSNAVSSCWGKERILRELEKCLVLCPNCHAKLHYDLRHGV